MNYTKCSEFTSDTPTPRSLNLVSAIEVVLGFTEF